MADLSQFRGKRALVCGIPRDGTRTRQAWVDATRKAIQSLGITHALVLGERHAWPDIEKAKRSECGVVLCVSSSILRRRAQDEGNAAGIPVLRVRRDGTVEVEASDG